MKEYLKLTLMAARALLIFILIMLIFQGIKPVKAAEEADDPIALTATTLSAGVVQEEGIFLPRGFQIPAELRTPIDTRVVKVGDLITMQTTEDIIMGEYTIVPANSFVHGFISDYRGPGRLLKNPKLEITFTGLSLPGDHPGAPRKQIAIKGKITSKQFKSASNKVSDSMDFKKKATYVGGIVGLTVGTATGMAYSSIGPLTNKLVVAGTGLSAAGIAVSLLKKDDLRIEPGTRMEIRLEEPSMQSFPHDIVAKKEGMQNVELTPEEQFDRVYNFKSESL